MDKIFAKEIIAPFIIIFVFIILYIIISSIIKKIANLKLTKVEQKRKNTLVSLINNIIKYFFMIIALLMILSIYGIDTSSIIASLGVVSLVAGLACQDTLKDFLSGFFIIFENQYAIGDTISINGFKGEVISLGLKTTKLKAATGEINIISNRNIDSVINYSMDNSVAIVDFQVAYEENLDKVEQVLTELCLKLTNELEGLRGEIKLLGVTELASSGVSYRIIVDTEPMKHNEIQRIILKEIKNELDKKNISIPYTQVVIHNA